MKQRITLVFLAFFFGLLLVAWTVPAKAQVEDSSAPQKDVLAIDVSKPYTIFSLNIAPYSLHLDYQAAN